MPYQDEIGMCKAERILHRIKKHIGGESKISNNNVPHLVIKGKETTYSICYFGSTRTIRVFDNYLNFRVPQKKYTFKEWGEVVRFLKPLTKEGRDENQKGDIKRSNTGFLER